MRGGFNPDLAHPCYNTIGRFRDAGVLQPLDVDRLKNWPDVFAPFKAVDGVQGSTASSGSFRSTGARLP